MTRRIALITDSTCDIPQDWIKQYDITVVPLTIIFGSQQYRDGVDLTAEQFYRRLIQETNHPTTSQPTPNAFLDAYCAAADQGAEEIITVTISSAMSGTMESARRAAQGFKIPVHVIDGKCTSMGLGWQVIAAARIRDAGGTLEDMLLAVEFCRKEVAFYVSLDTIEYLSKGGRIAEAARFLDSVLQIKPLVYISTEKGIVSASMPARSRKSAVEGLFKEFFRHINTNHPMHIAVLHNIVPDEAQALAEWIERVYAPKELIISSASPILGVHSGPRAIAISGYGEQ